MSLGRLHLIPVPLAEETTHTIPEQVQQQACQLKYYFVENIRTARRFLKAFDKTVVIDEITFSEVNNQQSANINQLKQWLQAGYEVGLMSEAGCPAVADPGSNLVAAAQEIGAVVVPHIGPSSILLALMASGFNGQGFRFAGYLPVKEPMRSKAIKELEALASQKQETQIFIETPYRNNPLLEEIIKSCHPQKTKLCIAADITGATAMIQTKTIGQWAAAKPDLHKRPTIFLIHPA
ncbi:SAM-dependent methyltransferase [Taibaiella sp. KBW10]|uniref:SAM-dependent methyltransferase n=1 Tax=Taibaiella sp. KBW10 TaxID=2153357 RepID=UPI000F5A8D10|nr:SAM-dependent methyltransferase [Taibaiella sp. KBW10]RQO30082.1 SAM-dependent methyltransferase [Taibaiella sp. KBW10]